MCGDDNYEQVAVSDHRWRRARKSHACCGCERAIQRGELYHYTSMLSAGHWYSYAHCAGCWAILCHLWSAGGEALHLELNCGEEYDAPDDDPGHALAFMTVPEQQAWALSRIAGGDDGSPAGSWVLG